ncbi:hypothetical protein O6H91_17G044100 [Diphasiastrum complanatum]|uniref:Uncharacterized protein n=1 Tax=Diphasiastrum complanatum TaxID=34168 RepID=A0ACC2B689_DIPCM|nr:hypothetical protein O6H91_17G044100 [Diphasiastrum complanatum]
MSYTASRDLGNICTVLLSSFIMDNLIEKVCLSQFRLKQHNGEIRGGAKAARAGRPWRLACTIHGFGTRSEACQFEWHWKHITRSDSNLKVQVSAADLLKGAHLMQRRQVALEKVQNKDTAWKRLKVHWHL